MPPACSIISRWNRSKHLRRAWRTPSPAASIFSDISLTIAMTPSDFVWQWFMQGKKGACKEWPITEEEFITVENIRGMLKTMLPVGSALFVKLAFSAAKKYPRECKTARMDIDRRMTRVICNWRDKT